MTCVYQNAAKNETLFRSAHKTSVMSPIWRMVMWSNRLWEHVSTLKPTPVGKFNDLSLKPLSNKMAGYQGDEPSTKFCEIIYVGRKENGRQIRPHDVTIFYKFKSGRGGRLRS